MPPSWAFLYRSRAFVASPRVPYVPHLERTRGSYVSASAKLASALPVSEARSSTIRAAPILGEQRAGADHQSGRFRIIFYRCARRLRRSLLRDLVHRVDLAARR